VPFRSATFVECLWGSKSCSLSILHLISVMYSTFERMKPCFGKIDYLNLIYLLPLIYNTFIPFVFEVGHLSASALTCL
jgi:hypothetical protein